MLFQLDTTATKDTLKTAYYNISLTMLHTIRLTSNLCLIAKMAKPRYANTQVSKTANKIK